MQSIRIATNFQDDRIRFQAYQESDPCPISLPIYKLSAEHRRALDASAFSLLSAIEELLLEEIISEDGPGTWSMDHGSIYDAWEQAPDSARALGFPKASRVETHLRSVGVPRSADFKMEVDVKSQNHGVLSGRFPRHGGIYQLGESENLLVPREVFALLRQAENGLAKTDTDPAAASIYVAESIRMAKDAGSTLEGWLENEDYVFPESIGIGIDQTGENEIRLAPRAEGIESEKLQEVLRQSMGRKRIVWSAEGRARKRMILSEDQKQTLADFDGPHKTLSGVDIPRFLETPEAFLPEGVDLSQFSERVRGIKIRVYHSQPYVTVNKTKYDWFPETGVDFEEVDLGASSDSKVSDEPSTSLPPPAIPTDAYEELVKRSLRDKTPFVEYEGAFIRIDPREAEGYLKARDLERQYNPADGNSLPKGATLEIFQNLDAIEFRHPGFSLEGEESIKPEKDRSVEFFDVPSLLHGTLMPHQNFGYRWLRTLNKRAKGGLLADDMGLGKTVQVIALLAARKEAGTVSPSLVVVRKSLIENWFRELKTFCPELKTLPVMTSPFPPESFLTQFDVVLLSYDTLRRNIIALGRMDWKVVCCDEAQDIKNPTTGRTDAAKALKSEIRIAMTGTPVENGLSELWCIMDFVQSGLLGSLKEFRTKYEKPIVRAENKENRDAASRALLNQILDHYLRRNKEEVLHDLPPKEIHPLHTPLSGSQKDRYVQLVREGKGSGRGGMLSALQKLLLLCAYPWGDQPPESINFDEAAVQQCPKLEAVFEVLDGVRGAGEKALIFADRKIVHRFLQKAIWSRYGITPSIINGDMTEGRQQVVDYFNDSHGFNVLILSPRVGGAGLNITSANHVIHYMRPWNPAVENQATDRTHRIGQKKVVHVYYPIATHDEFQTVEQVLNQLLEDKRQLATDVLVPSMNLRADEKEMMERVFQASA